MMKDEVTLQRRQKGTRHTGNIDETGKHNVNELLDEWNYLIQVSEASY